MDQKPIKKRYTGWRANINRDTLYDEPIETEIQYIGWWAIGHRDTVDDEPIETEIHWMMSQYKQRDTGLRANRNRDTLDDETICRNRDTLDDELIESEKKIWNP